MKKILPIIIAALTFAGGAKAQTTTTIFDSGNGRSPYYRIPAILNQNGTLWAFTDDRSNVSSTVSWGDIGCGEISIIAKKSTDNGASWSSSTTKVATGSNSASGFYKAHGDAAVVCDRENPNKMLVMCASGEKSYGSSTVGVKESGSYLNKTYELNLDDAIRVGKYTSTDGGVTWSGDDVTKEIYGIWDTKTTGWFGQTTGYNTTVQKLFFSSGRICQSAIIKKDNNSCYRLYAALCTNEGSLVVYSDDFGKTWSALGATGERPAGSGDEAKIEELPNGNVLLSCRMSTTSSKTSGRYFNIFTYTDQSSATGSWGTAVTSNSSSDGTYAYWNNTNGEILLVPAMAKDSNVPVYIALQSVPAGNTKNTTDQNTYKRSNVSIYWKVLSSTSDLDAPSDFTNGWTKYEVSSTTSAYSSMVLDKNGDVAFIYEENAINTTIGGSGNMDYYDIQFKSLPLSTITNGAYTYTTAKDVDTHRTAFLNNTTIDDSGETADQWAGKVVTLKHTITVNGKTTERYLCNEGLKLTLESASDNEIPDYKKYWVISKDPEGSYYYLSSLNGDGYLGRANGTPLGDGSGSVVTGGDAVCTDNYISEFRITDFVKTFCYESGFENVTVTHTDGWAIKFIIRYADKNYDEERVLVIATDGTINWSKHTQNPNPENGHTWSSEFIITEVGKASAVNDFGTFANPTHFGFPVKMTRSDNDKADITKEGYYYYATLKLPFAVDLKSAKDASGRSYDLTVLKCTTPKDKPGEEVELTDITNTLTKNTLPRETPVILRMGTKDTPADPAATQITLYLQPALAQNIIWTTGLKGSLGKKTFTDAEYDPANANFFILGKKDDGRVKFYYMSNQVLAANKAYYVYEGTRSAKSLVFRFDDDNISTGISLPETIETTGDAVIYDLSGRRVAGTAKKGVYIRNGKKYIVK
ncbi:MAG: glycoside hydrolase [Bacteroidales bacterium]|nr:glycoside hydrolase [Bacteroidales bacterium]